MDVDLGMVFDDGDQCTVRSTSYTYSILEQITQWFENVHKPACRSEDLCTVAIRNLPDNQPG